MLSLEILEVILSANYQANLGSHFINQLGSPAFTHWAWMAKFEGDFQF